MTKAEITLALESAGIEHDPTALKADLEALLPVPISPPSALQVEEVEAAPPEFVTACLRQGRIAYTGYRAGGEAVEFRPGETRRITRQEFENWNAHLADADEQGR